MTFGKPMIPNAIMSDLVDLRESGKEYRPDMGGQYLPGAVERVPFRGAVLPLSPEDLRRAPQGTYGAEARKVYANGHDLTVGAWIEDVKSGETYLITADLSYGSIHPLRRYAAERKAVSR